MTDKKSASEEEVAEVSLKASPPALKWKWGKKDLRPKYIRKPKRGSRR
jgi:hypothetical protein